MLCSFDANAPYYYYCCSLVDRLCDPLIYRCEVGVVLGAWPGGDGGNGRLGSGVLVVGILTPGASPSDLQKKLITYQIFLINIKQYKN